MMQNCYHLLPCQWQSLRLILATEQNRLSIFSKIPEQYLINIAKIFIDLFPKSIFVKEHKYTIYPTVSNFPKRAKEELFQVSYLIQHAVFDKQKEAKEIVFKNGSQIINLGYCGTLPLVWVLRRLESITQTYSTSISAMKILLTLGADVNGVLNESFTKPPNIIKKISKCATPLWIILNTFKEPPRLKYKNYRIYSFSEERVHNIALYLRMWGGIVYPPLDPILDQKATALLKKIDGELFNKPAYLLAGKKCKESPFSMMLQELIIFIGCLYFKVIRAELEKKACF